LYQSSVIKGRGLATWHYFGPLLMKIHLRVWKKSLYITVITQIRKGLNCPETFYLLYRCCLWILTWLNNTATLYFVLNNQCPSIGGKGRVCGLDRLFGANRNGGWWRLEDLAIHLVSESCSENSEGTLESNTLLCHRQACVTRLAQGGPQMCSPGAITNHKANWRCGENPGKGAGGPGEQRLSWVHKAGDLSNSSGLCLFHHVCFPLLKKESSRVAGSTALGWRGEERF